jgi:hypothetical protein
MAWLDPQGFGLGLWLPAIALGGAAIVVPRWLDRHMRAGLRGVAANLALSAAALILLGGLVFLGLYAAQAPGLVRAALADPAGALLYFFRLGLIPAILWGPVLAIVGLGLAQKAVSGT